MNIEFQFVRDVAQCFDKIHNLKEDTVAAEYCRGLFTDTF